MKKSYMAGYEVFKIRKRVFRYVKLNIYKYGHIWKKETYSS
jgi:hypothetical protein